MLQQFKGSDSVIVRLIMCTVLNVMAWSMKIAAVWILEKIPLRKMTEKYSTLLKVLPLVLYMKNTVLGWGVLRIMQHLASLCAVLAS